MKWLDNLKNITLERTVGKCPICGSSHTDYKCSVLDGESGLGYMDIWCADCLNAFHVSRMVVTKGMKASGDVPKGLKY